MDLNRFRTYATYDELFLQGDAYSQAPGLSRRISRWRDEHVARKALILAGEPGLILNVPCNGGRFWPLLAEKSNRIIMAAEVQSRGMPWGVWARNGGLEGVKGSHGSP